MLFVSQKPSVVRVEVDSLTTGRAARCHRCHTPGWAVFVTRASPLLFISSALYSLSKMTRHNMQKVQEVMTLSQSAGSHQCAVTNLTIAIELVTLIRNYPIYPKTSAKFRGVGESAGVWAGIGGAGASGAGQVCVSEWAAAQPGLVFWGGFAKLAKSSTEDPFAPRSESTPALPSQRRFGAEEQAGSPCSHGWFFLNLSSLCS